MIEPLWGRCVLTKSASPTRNNVVKCTGFNTEEPWPNAEWQNCTAGQDPGTCFINVQNVVLDSIGQLWVVDSGIPADAAPGSDAVEGGAKIIAFDQNGTVRATHKIPKEDLAHGESPLSKRRTGSHAS